MNEQRRSFISALGGRMPNKEMFKSLPVISLLASNLFIAIFVIAENQSVLNILWVYWLQSVIIGVFNFFKMLSLKKFTVDGMKMNNKPLTESKSAKVGVAIFFLIHYGIFHAVYAGFLSVFSSMGVISVREVDYNFILLTSLVFMINYLGEFILWFKRDREEVYSLSRVMMSPYKRIIPMHLTIILSGFVMYGSVLGITDFSNAALLIFIGLKTFSDLLTDQ